MIGDEILVTVMEVSASTVRLGIEAPRGVSIFREEIWLAVKEENRAAAEAQADALPSAPIDEVREEAAAASGEGPIQDEPTQRRIRRRPSRGPRLGSFDSLGEELHACRADP